MKDILGNEDVIWDLTDLYKGTFDDNIQKDIENIPSKITLFSTKYRNKLNVISPGEFLDAVTPLEEIYQKTSRIGSLHI